MKKNFSFALAGVLLVLILSVAMAQEVQKVTIVGTEHKFEPSEITLKPGKAEITLINKGTVRHNLRIMVGDKQLRSGDTQAGQTVKLDVDLPAGEYQMYCSSSEGGGSHRTKGMVGKVIVK